MRWIANRPCPRCGQMLEFEAYQDYGSYYQPPESGIEAAHDFCHELTDAEWDALADSILTEGYNGYDGQID